MPFISKGRVLETSATVGVGPFALAAAVVGFRRFSAVCAVGDTLPYFIEAIDAVGMPSGDYEYGIGTYTAANELTRTTVLASSNGGALVNFAAGSKNVGLGLNESAIDTLINAGFNAAHPSAFAAALLAAFTGSNQSLGGNGYQKLPGGMILQWGSLNVTAGSPITVTYPIAFTANPRTVASLTSPSAGSNDAYVNAQTNTSFSANVAGSGVSSFTWIALGQG